jgi:hypothetical protein
MLLVTRPYIGDVNFEILTLDFDDDGYLWNLPRTGAFVLHILFFSTILVFFFQEHENVALLLLDKISDSNICNIANSELKT